jgi:hypothetical protein
MANYPVVRLQFSVLSKAPKLGIHSWGWDAGQSLLESWGVSKGDMGLENDLDLKVGNLF